MLCRNKNRALSRRVDVLFLCGGLLVALSLGPSRPAIAKSFINKLFQKKAPSVYEAHIAPYYGGPNWRDLLHFDGWQARPMSSQQEAAPSLGWFKREEVRQAAMDRAANLLALLSSKELGLSQWRSDLRGLSLRTHDSSAWSSPLAFYIHPNTALYSVMGGAVGPDPIYVLKRDPEPGVEPLPGIKIDQGPNLEPLAIMLVANPLDAHGLAKVLRETVLSEYTSHVALASVPLSQDLYQLGRGETIDLPLSKGGTASLFLRGGTPDLKLKDRSHPVRSQEILDAIVQKYPVRLQDLLGSLVKNDPRRNVPQLDILP